MSRQSVAKINVETNVETNATPDLRDKIDIRVTAKFAGKCTGKCGETILAGDQKCQSAALIAVAVAAAVAGLPSFHTIHTIHTIHSMQVTTYALRDTRVHPSRRSYIGRQQRNREAAAPQRLA